MGKMKELLDKRLEENKYELLEACKELIVSLQALIQDNLDTLSRSSILSAAKTADRCLKVIASIEEL